MPKTEQLRTNRMPLADRRKVTWLNFPPEQPQAPAPFDREACIKKAIQVSWFAPQNLEIPLFVTKEEAWFWIVLLVGLGNRLHGKTMEMDLRAHDFSFPDIGQIQNTLKQGAIPAHLLRPFLKPIQIAEIYLGKQSVFAQTGGYYLIDSFAKDILPFLAETERAELRLFLEAQYDLETNAKSDRGWTIIHFLGKLGSDRLTRHLASERNKQWANSSWAMGQRPPPGFSILAGLPSETLFVSEAKRLFGEELYYYSLELWLAATEWRELLPVQHFINNFYAKDEIHRYTRLLGQIVAPETAAVMVSIQLYSRSAKEALAWLRAHPLQTAVGLAPPAMGEGKKAEAAEAHLHELRQKCQQEILRIAKAHLPDAEADWLELHILQESVEPVEEECTPAEIPGDLTKALQAKGKPFTRPNWISERALDPIRLQGKILPRAAIPAILAALKATPQCELHPLLDELRKVAQMEPFAWSLFAQWMNAGTPANGAWTWTTLGRFGGDSSVIKLVPLIRQWPAQGEHKLAAKALICLQAIGTDAAVTTLSGVAQSAKSAPLREKARELIAKLAVSRGLTPEQLGDRIVPDFGLNEKGSRVFDYGPRQFQLFLCGDLKLQIRDSRGKLHENLPKPNQSDDAAKAGAVLEEWKVLKKTLSEALKVQASRLENAMIEGRRWVASDFRKYFLNHPFMINLVRGILWGIYDEAGKLATPFRIAEDGSPADESDRELTKDSLESGRIGIVHPFHLTPEPRQRWVEIVNDYAMIPPFPQLGRALFLPDPQELKQTELTRLEKVQINGLSLLGILDRHHWSRGVTLDRVFDHHTRFFEGPQITAVVLHTEMRIYEYDEAQSIRSVYFARGRLVGDPVRLKIREVDSIALSEVLSLLSAISLKTS